MTDQSEQQGYKGHQAGSRKGRVHQAFDEQDADVALARIFIGLTMFIALWLASRSKKASVGVCRRGRFADADCSRRSMRLSLHTRQ